MENKWIEVLLLKRMMQVSIGLLVLLTIVACSSNDEVVVETDSGNITKEELYEEMLDRAGESTLQEMITIKILEESYDVDEDEVDERLEETKSQIGDQFDMWLMQQGIPDEDAFRDLLKTSMLYEEAAYGDIEISDEEIEKQYERMTTEVQVQHILVDDEDTANEVIEKLEDGEDFGELAEEYSQDEGSADNEGKYDYFSVGEMVPEFEDASYTLEIDTISEPVESDHGFHVIKVLDRRDIEEDIGDLEDMRETIISELRQTKVSQEEAQEKIDKLIEDSNINIKIEAFEDLFEDLPEEDMDPLMEE